ncbi:MAG: alpha/beta hydrolase [Microcoleus sp. SIO2G3]|nr:alpha/beta hydrolase [Microcoleus sp. SIO2G3]
MKLPKRSQNLLQPSKLLSIVVLGGLAYGMVEMPQAITAQDSTTKTANLQTRLMATSVQPQIVREDFYVTSDPGIQIFVREVRATSSPTNTRAPILLLHGGGGAGLASFDVNVPGYSVAEDLARDGHPIYIMNVRGFERSTRIAQLDAPPEANPPLVTSEEALRDIDAVVDWIRTRKNGQSVALVGWATGGHWAGMYTSRNNDKVSHLVMLNSLYGVNAPWEYRQNFENPERPGEFDGRGAAYRQATADGLIANWTRAIPTDDKSQWRDPAVAQAYQQITLDNDPTSGTRQPPSVRLPGAFRLEAYNLSRGQKYWEALDIRVPTLYIRGELDHWSRPEDLRTLEAELVNAPNVRTVTIPEGTHFLLLDRPERGRDRFIAEVLSFTD